ncbi:MAG: glutamine--fructose-6-phosphate transaminase (isomerizing) [Patescibacteria group bacterium]
MCGIFGYVGPRTDGATIVLEGLKQLEYRGYDSWGVAVMPTGASNKIVVKKKTGKIGEANVKDMPSSSFAFGHTRWATHGGVSEVNAHPHLDCTGSIAIIHNGILENYEALKQKLLKKGHRFISQTDTEVAVHLIEEYAKSMLFSKAVQKAFNDMEGLNAFIAMNKNNHQFVAVRSGSPLVVGFGDGENFLASDAAAMLPYTRQVHFLEDDEMALVSAKGVMMFNARTGARIKPQKQTLTWSVSEVEKGAYPFFMLKEIHEQPGVMADIAADNAEHAVKLAGIIKQSYGTYMVGCGTAAYACLAGSYLFSKIARRHVNWAIGSEFGYQLDFLTDKSLILALSQSGETMDLLDSVKKAKEKKAKIAALVNVLGSSLWRLADYTLVIGAGPEKGVASTKAFIGKLAHLTLLAYALDGRIREGQKVVTMAVKSAKAVLAEPTVSRIQKLAKKIQKARHVYVIGRGLSYPAALEIALKIKEISYIHAEGLAAGELKHGPLALVEKGTPCIALLPEDETYGANLAGAMEMKARGGYIIGISHKPHEVFDYFVPIADAKEATIIPMVIAGQLLAYYLTIARGFDPDKPRNLAKSVTVK